MLFRFGTELSAIHPTCFPTRMRSNFSSCGKPGMTETQRETHPFLATDHDLRSELVTSTGPRHLLDRFCSFIEEIRSTVDENQLILWGDRHCCAAGQVNFETRSEIPQIPDTHHR